MRALLLSIALTLCTSAIAADPALPHPHQGVLAPFAQPPELPVLMDDDLARLAEGKSVKKQDKTGDGGGRGTAIQDISADPATVWATILQFEHYPEWVDNVIECETYANSGDAIDARFKIGAMLVKVEYYIHHVVDTDAGWMTWTLDYTRESDLDDSVGYWRTVARDDQPGTTRLYYSVDVRLRGWVPGWVSASRARGQEVSTASVCGATMSSTPSPPPTRNCTRSGAQAPRRGSGRRPPSERDTRSTT